MSASHTGIRRTRGHSDTRTHVGAGTSACAGACAHEPELCVRLIRVCVRVHVHARVRARAPVRVHMRMQFLDVAYNRSVSPMHLPRSMSCVRVTSAWAYHTSDRERMSSHRAYINIGISFFRLELSRCISLSPSLPLRLPLPLSGETSSDPTSSIPFSVRVGADVGINERRLVPFVHLHTQTRPVTSAEAQKQRSITNMLNNLIGRTS